MGKEKGQGGEWGWEIRKGDSGRGRRRGGKRNGKGERGQRKRKMNEGGKGKGMVEQERGRGREGKGEEKVWFASLTHIGSENAISQYIYELWDWGGVRESFRNF